MGERTINQKSFKEVNDGYVEAEDILSNSVYYYDRKKGKDYDMP